MYEFIPYLPLNTKGITEEQWRTAREAWIRHLNDLLEETDNGFVDNVISNRHLQQFIDTFQTAQLDGEQVDAELSKLVFLVYLRAADLVAIGSPVFSSTQLINFAVIYGDANPNTVRKVFFRLLDNSPALLDAVQESIVTMVQCMRSMPEHLQRTRPSMERAYVVVRVLDALVSATMDVKDIWNQQQVEIERFLFACYNDLTSTLAKAGGEEHDDLDLHAYLIKSTLVSLFNSLMEIIFFRPLGFVFDRQDHSNEIKSSQPAILQADIVVDDFSKHLLSLLENSGLDHPREAFKDASLIMDWEVEYAITNKLAAVNKTLFNGYPFLTECTTS
ncbi:hypothetical protein EC973_006365 [Apophysomyces ossiformis]|uniref:Uncharacterized protein n=1 Tax=Apophysomyces ossiformis TaxID=679940 RepID=A0A8H7BXV4_9FUNG|nr:hypothetical protein EC973_006365 [Apophysomyces ossiformis]